MSALSVLLIEDDPDQARLLTRWLEGAGGFDVVLACDGGTASRLLWSRPWSLIISDIELPGVDGLGLLRRFRAGYPDTPFVIISARRTIEDAHTALRLHADDFLPKPLDRDGLVRCARRLTLGRLAPAGRVEVGPTVQEEIGGLAEQVATSLTVTGGVADILGAMSVDQPIPAATAQQCSGLLTTAARGLERTLSALQRVADMTTDGARAEVCDVVRDVLHAAGSRFAASGVRLHFTTPGEPLVVGMADHQLRRVLHAILLALAENAALCGVRSVHATVRPSAETVSVEVDMERTSGHDDDGVLQSLLGLLSQEATRAGVPCLVADAAPVTNLRLSLRRIVHRRTA